MNSSEVGLNVPPALPRLGGAVGLAVCLACLGSSVAAQTPSVPWRVSLWAEDQALADGLPVLALARDDWYVGLPAQASHYRAWRQVQLGVTAEHPSGWYGGWLARSMVQLQASSAAVTLAATNAQKTDPPLGDFPDVAVRSTGWRGMGLQLGMPWQPLGAERWRWRAQGQWLQLAQARQNNLQGQVSHKGGGLYELQLQAHRWGDQIQGPFLPASGAAGWGASLSVALEGELAPGWQLALRADDLLSRLRWSALSQEQAVIDSAVGGRTPDGFLDYGPLVQGQQSLSTWKGRIPTRWQLDLRHQQTTGALTWQSSHWQGLQQHWLGWHHNTRSAAWAWQLALEPQRRALAAGVQWRGLSLNLATDGEDSRHTRYRQWALNWQVPQPF